MSRTRTFEGRGTAADARVNLTNQGSVSSPNQDTPKGAKKIDVIVASIGSDIVAAGRAGFLLRVGGDAVKNGEQTIVVGAEGFTAAESGASDPGIHVRPWVLENADIEVDGSEAIVVDVEMLDGDLGDVDASVTLIFD